MKKILMVLLCVIVIIIIGTTFVLIYPNFYKIREVNEFNISFRAPIHYEQKDVNENDVSFVVSKESEEKKVVKFESARTGIGISIYTFEKNFLRSGIAEKLEDYSGLLEAVNYDCVLENVNSEIVQISQLACGKYTAGIKSIKQLNKEKTIIIPMEEYDLIFSVYGIENEMQEHEKQIEKILNSIKIK